MKLVLQSLAPEMRCKVVAKALPLGTRPKPRLGPAVHTSRAGLEEHNKANMGADSSGCCRSQVMAPFLSMRWRRLTAEQVRPNLLTQSMSVRPSPESSRAGQRRTCHMG
eukprot:scaffold3551_cov408-Prasinococcus_capsulatus_cf.AAC.11